MSRLFCLFLVILSLAVPRLGAAEADTTVYFLNIYPGAEIYELEGHSAIVVDIRGRQPLSYNFGVFDFNTPNFVYRFVKGETDYMAVEWPLEPFLAPYAMQGRRVVAHRLDFDSRQKARIIALLKENVRPENAIYRYNYVKDNCATRPLRVVELAAGDSIMLAPAPFEANSFPQPTFRNIMRSYHRNYPWYQFGIDLALGSGIDYTLTRREMAFAPAELDGMLDGATVGGRRLVGDTQMWVDYPAGYPLAAPTPWYATPLFLGWCVFALAFVLTIRDLRRHRTTRWFDAAYFAVMGVTGLVLTFLIFVSVHEATSPNWLYVWLNPLCLLVPALIYIKKAKKVLIWYQIANFAVLFALLIGWYFLPQSANAAFLPLVLADMTRAASYVIINRR